MQDFSENKARAECRRAFKTIHVVRRLYPQPEMPFGNTEELKGFKVKHDREGCPSSLPREEEPETDRATRQNGGRILLKLETN
jgi:hypothetical protein